MSRPKKPPAIDTFRMLMADARALLLYARAFTNQRKYRMRRELRDRIGVALKLTSAQRSQLDCLQSDDVFTVFMPGGDLHRSDFLDLRPLLRQAVVAGCSALEAYVAQRASEFIGPALRAGAVPTRLCDVSMSVGHWLEIEQQYRRRGWGVRKVVEDHIRETSSSAPSRIGEVLSTIGVKDWAKKADAQRRVTAGTTVSQLQTISDRRNAIAHDGDRSGAGRASLEPDEAETMLGTLSSVAEAIETICSTHSL